MNIPQTFGKTPKVIVGLGNPDPDLTNTYHNVGILALEAVAQKLQNESATEHKSGRGKYCRYLAMDGRYLVWPLVYMNDSGRAVQEALAMANADKNDLIVLHDDSDIPIGEAKIYFGGGSAGHKGVQSVIDHLHSQEFWRLRIGIRNLSEQVRKKAEDFVLTPIKIRDRETLNPLLVEIADLLGGKTAPSGY
jgi:peptidyl-tRNA hydrolase, PTH1 family